MKKILTFIILFISCQSFGQTYPSNCTVPAVLKSTYQWDVRNLALRRIVGFHSPDTALVTIPQPWQDTIAEGMAAILNAIAMPQRDSIFNLYCVHDKTPNVVFIDKEIMVAVDTTWHFRVLPDCSVEFLGRTDLGYFGIQPLPLPENCNLFTGISPYPDHHTDFRLYPNPSYGSVTLNIEGYPVTSCIIRVYSVTGELVHSSSFTGSNPTLDLSMLIPGFYTIHLEDGQKTFSHKLVLCK